MQAALLPLAFGVAASAATLLGGALALRFQQRITLVLGLAAGVVLGVALFDLLPEALELGSGTHSPRAMLGYVALGLGGYLLLARSSITAQNGPSSWRAHLGPASLTLHSFLDGMGIGLAFQVSADIGWMVALAVLTHDIADGVNTVSLSLTGAKPGSARRWLVANGAAPLLGVCVGLSTRLPDLVLAPLMAAFAGIFLYIGACELLPRSYARDPRLRVTIASLAGVLLMLLITHWAR
jgi:zinc transporter ZupT